MNQLPLIVSLLLMLAFARMLGEFFERINQPAMVGEILAGIILGPTILGWVSYTNDINAISDLAILLLIIHAGLEIKIEDIRESIKGKKVWIALFGFIIPFISGVGLGMLFGFNSYISTFLGLCISITALPVSVRILVDLGKLNSHVGRHILSAAIFNDVIALLILGVLLNLNVDSDVALTTLLSSIAITVLKILAFILFLVIAYKVLSIVTKRLNKSSKSLAHYLDFLKGKESTFAMVMIFVLIFASLAEINGLHFVVGAFFGAILLPQEIISDEQMDVVSKSTGTITMGLLAPIFFAAIGVEFNLFSIDSYWLLAIVLIVAFGSKIAGGYVAGRIVGYSHAKSGTIGIGLNARGIIELVIANIALKNGLIDQSLFSILVLMGIVTTLTTPILLACGFKYMEKVGDNP